MLTVDSRNLEYTTSVFSNVPALSHFIFVAEFFFGVMTSISSPHLQMRGRGFAAISMDAEVTNLEYIVMPKADMD